MPNGVPIFVLIGCGDVAAANNKQPKILPYRQSDTFILYCCPVKLKNLQNIFGMFFV